MPPYASRFRVWYVKLLGKANSEYNIQMLWVVTVFDGLLIRSTYKLGFLTLQLFLWHYVKLLPYGSGT